MVIVKLNFFRQIDYEFLAKKIAKGREDYKNGRYVTLAELDKEIEELLINKERELQAFESSLTNS